MFLDEYKIYFTNEDSGLSFYEYPVIHRSNDRIYFGNSASEVVHGTKYDFNPLTTTPENKQIELINKYYTHFLNLLINKKNRMANLTVVNDVENTEIIQELFTKVLKLDKIASIEFISDEMYMSNKNSLFLHEKTFLLDIKYKNTIFKKYLHKKNITSTAFDFSVHKLINVIDKKFRTKLHVSLDAYKIDSLRNRKASLYKKDSFSKDEILLYECVRYECDTLIKELKKIISAMNFTDRAFIERYGIVLSGLYVAEGFRNYLAKSLGVFVNEMDI